MFKAPPINEPKAVAVPAVAKAPPTTAAAPPALVNAPAIVVINAVNPCPQITGVKSTTVIAFFISNCSG